MSFHFGLAQGLRAAAVAVAVSGAFLTTAKAGPTLDAIQQRGLIKVGVGTSPGFFAPDSNGKWQGFFVDFGRALAVTVFNDPNKVEFTSSSPQQRLPALQAGEFDILLSGVTQTTSAAQGRRMSSICGQSLSASTPMSSTRRLSGK